MGGSGLGHDSGIGGSGLFGTITGFASVCVNGVEVRIGAETSIERFGRAAAPSELAVGHVVWIEAARRGGQLHAEQVSVLTAAVVWLLLFRDANWGADRTYLFLDMMPVATIFAAATAALVIVSLVTRPPSQRTLEKYFPVG